MTAASQLFICAAGRSGSTLLDLVLGSHSEVSSLGEITQLPKNVALNTTCACGDSVRDCAFWREVLRRMGDIVHADLWTTPYALDLGFIDARVVVDDRHQHVWYNLQRRLYNGAAWLAWRHGVPGLGWAEHRLLGAVRNNLALYQVVREVADKPVVVDSTKHYLKAVGLHREAPEQTRVVLLTRDGRGVFYSNRRHGFDREVSLESWYRHFSHTLPLFERTIRATHLMQVRYEDLCRDPTATIARVCDFVGLAFEAEMLDFANHVHHVANGNDMRLAKMAEIRCDERWRNELQGDDLDYFKRHAWALNRRLGYDD